MRYFSPRNLLILVILVSTIGYTVYRATRRYPAVWPDQDWIVFSCARPVEGGDIYRMLPDGTNLIRLTHTDKSESNPHWASSSGWLYFWVGDTDYYADADGSIRRMRFDGRGSEKFWPDAANGGFDLAPSEDILVFVGSEIDFRDNIEILKIKEDEPTLFPNLIDSADWYWSPKFSPDGEWIAYLSDRDGNREIYLMRPDGSEQTRLTETDGDERDFTWSPDSKFIIFSSGRLIEANLLKIDVSTHEIQPIAEWQGTQDYPLWSPDGEWIYFSSASDINSESSQIYKMHLDGTDIQQLTHMNCSAFDLQWIAPRADKSANSEPAN